MPKHLIPLLRGAVDTFAVNPVILIPFLSIAFIQLLLLELFYFAPRFPLSVFFNPIIATLWGEEYIHYPNSFLILPKLFQNTQVLIYLFVSSYFIAVAIALISAINNHAKPRFGQACKEAFGYYIHILMGAVLSFGVFFGLYKLYNLMMAAVLNLSAVDDTYIILDQVMVKGAPYITLILGAFVTALFAFVYPVIMIDRKKILPALGLNFKYLWGSFWYVFSVVLVPTLLYVPVLLLRSNIDKFAHMFFPEVRVLVLVFSVFVTMLLDVTIYTAITMYYLLKREQ